MNDNECLKWCMVSSLHPEDHHSEGIRKIDEILADELDFEDIRSIALVFLVMKVRQNIQSIYQKTVMKTNMLIYYR